MQAFTLKRYPAPLSLTTWMNMFGAAQTAFYTVLTQRKAGVWNLGFNIDLWAIIYAVRKFIELKFLTSFGNHFIFCLFFIWFLELSLQTLYSPQTFFFSSLPSTNGMKDQAKIWKIKKRRLIYINVTKT